jgi:hypothetical protein
LNENRATFRYTPQLCFLFLRLVGWATLHSPLYRRESNQSATPLTKLLQFRSNFS